MAFLKEVKRRNVIRVAGVYLVTAWLILQVISVISPYLKLPDMLGTVVTVLLIIGLPLVCIFAWAFELTPEGIKPTRTVDEDASIAPQTGQKMNRILLALIALLITYVAIDKLWLTQPSSASIVTETEPDTEIQNEAEVLAVLPFLNLSTDPDQEIFVDGLTEELLNTLVRIRELKVLGRTSSFAYKDVQKDLTVIASELNADYLIEGSVRKSGDDLRITVQLIEASSGAHLFSDTFDRKLEDVFAVQEEVSDQVASALKLNLIHQDDRYAAALDKLDYKAVEQLVVARALASRRTTNSVNQAKLILDELLNQYPDTAAILGLAAYVGVEDVSSTENDDVSIKHIIKLAERALELDPVNRDALLSLAVVYDDFDQLTDEALQLYEQAVATYPHDYEFWFQYFGVLVSRLAPCEDIADLVARIPSQATTATFRNRLDYFVLACLAPEEAEDLKARAKTEDIERYTRYRPIGEAQIGNILYLESQNERNTALQFYALSRLGAKDRAIKVLNRLDMQSDGLWATLAYTSGYLNGYPLPDKTFDKLWHAIIQNEFFWLSTTEAIVLVDLARRSEQISELRQRVRQLVPPTLNRQQLYTSFNYLFMLRLLGDNEQSIAVANQLLDMLTNYQKAYPESFAFYQLHAVTLFTAMAVGNMAHAESMLEELPQSSAIALFGLEETRYLFRDLGDHPLLEKVLTAIDNNRQYLRNKYELD
uniref:tetratricopeptide repeat protein n=1 Tax=Ningiella ruwaisensis TaxID=2364274 RepID=UPI0010A0426A|nr:tetratricopeptide repeat protein [Ningiella ruwaisensis]